MDESRGLLAAVAAGFADLARGRKQGPMNIFFFSGSLYCSPARAARPRATRMTFAPGFCSSTRSGRRPRRGATSTGSCRDWADDATVLPPGSPPVVGKPAIREFVAGISDRAGAKVTAPRPSKPCFCSTPGKWTANPGV